MRTVLASAVDIDLNDILRLQPYSLHVAYSPAYCSTVQYASISTVPKNMLWPYGHMLSRNIILSKRSVSLLG